MSQSHSKWKFHYNHRANDERKGKNPPELNKLLTVNKTLRRNCRALPSTMLMSIKACRVMQIVLPLSVHRVCMSNVDTFVVHLNWNKAMERKYIYSTHITVTSSISGQNRTESNQNERGRKVEKSHAVSNVAKKKTKNTKMKREWTPTTLVQNMIRVTMKSLRKCDSSSWIDKLLWIEFEPPFLIPIRPRMLQRYYTLLDIPFVMLSLPLNDMSYAVASSYGAEPSQQKRSP